MAVLISGKDASSYITKGSVNINNNIHESIDTADFSVNPNSLHVQGGEEVIITNDIAAISEKMLVMRQNSNVPENDPFGKPSRYLTLPADEWLISKAITIEFLCEITGMESVLYNEPGEGLKAARRIIFAIFNNQGLTPNSDLLRLSLGNDRDLKLEIAKQGGVVQTLASTSTQILKPNTTGYNVADPAIFIHIAITISSSGIAKIYVDGIDVTIAGTTVTLPDTAFFDSFDIGMNTALNGASYTINNNPFYGMSEWSLNYIRMWNKVRTITEIKDNMFKEIQPVLYVDQLIGYWRFQTIDSSKVLDFTNENRNMTTKNISISNFKYTDDGSLLFSGLTNAPIKTPVAIYGTRMFAGFISNPQEEGEKLSLGYSVSCQDYSAGMNGELVVENYLTIKQDDNTTYYPNTDSRTKTLGKIIRDILTKYNAVGISGAEVIADIDGPIIDSIGFNYTKVTDCFSNLQSLAGYNWYVDAYKVLHFFDSKKLEAPEELTDSSKNFKELRFSIDTSQLVNKVYVRGGKEYINPEKVAENQIDQTKATEGYTRENMGGALSKNLLSAPYPLSDGFKIRKKNGAGTIVDYIAKSNSSYKIIALKIESATGKVISEYVVGIKNVNAALDSSGNPTVFTLFINTDESIPYYELRESLLSTEEVQLFFQIRIPVLTSSENSDSIKLIKSITGGKGIIEHFINDENIVTLAEAKNRANAELTQFSKFLISGSFETHKHGFFAGQTLRVNIIRINNSSNLIYDDFVIQSVNTQSDGVGWTYQVEFANKQPENLVKFLQGLVQKTSKFTFSSVERLEIIISGVDEINIDEYLDTTDENTQPKVYSSGRQADDINDLITNITLSDYNSSPNKSGVRYDSFSQGITLKQNKTEGFWESIWIDRQIAVPGGYVFRPVLSYTSNMTLGSGAVSIFFRSSKNADGSSSTRWKNLSEVKTTLDRYIQIKFELKGE